MAGAGLSTDGGEARRRSAARRGPAVRGGGASSRQAPERRGGGGGGGAGTKGGSLPSWRPRALPGPARHAANQRARRGTRPRRFPHRALPGLEEPPRPRGRAEAGRPEGRGRPRQLRGGCSRERGWGVVCAEQPRLVGGRVPASSATGRGRRALRLRGTPPPEGCAPSTLSAWLKLSASSGGAEVVRPSVASDEYCREPPPALLCGLDTRERQSRSGSGAPSGAPVRGSLAAINLWWSKRGGCAANVLRNKKEELRRKQTMKVLVIGLGGVTNGGKTTLAEKLKNMLPNCDIISQDDFFKPESEVETDERGFKLYDVLDALYMDEMVTSIRNWIKSPASSGVVTEERQNTCDSVKNVFILIVEGFLLYNYEPLNELWNRRYFLTLPYEECKRRRSTRVYQPADTPGYFDGHVWPMYLKYKSELEENASMQVDYLDGTKSQEELLSYVYNDIIQELNKLREEKQLGIDDKK